MLITIESVLRGSFDVLGGGILVVVNDSASYDCCLDNKLYVYVGHCFSPLQKECQHHYVSQSIMSMNRCVITECLVSPVSSPPHLAWCVVDMEWVRVLIYEAACISPKAVCVCVCVGCCVLYSVVLAWLCCHQIKICLIICRMKVTS